MDNVENFINRANQYISERERLDVKAVYDKLKDTYPLVLTNTFSLETGAIDYGEDFEILLGESSAGKFQLYDNGLYIVFDVDKSDGTYTHWHPENTAEAADDVMLFMQGLCKD